MVERFSGRIAEVLRTHHFRSRDELEATLKRYVWLYNQHLPHKGDQSPHAHPDHEGLAGP